MPKLSEGHFRISMTATAQEKPYFSKVTVIGVGLIGGSLALKMKANGLWGTVVGVGRSKANLEKAVELGVIDSFTHDVSEGVRGADLVIIAVPVRTTIPVLKDAVPALKIGAIVTDVGSVKGGIVDEAEKLMPEGVFFVGAHPIAGTEYSGVEAAFATLFEGRRCILTPTGKTSREAFEAVGALWRAAGSKLVEMDTAAHDKVLASVSHLPHMIAYSLVNSVADVDGEIDGVLGFSAGGFKDFTRIASSSPAMWLDICAMNRDALLDVIKVFESRVTRLKTLLQAEDYTALMEEFERAKRVRDSI